MIQGLLAHLSFRLTNQHEVIATEGLAYVLQQSNLCRGAIEQFAEHIGCHLPEIVSYQAEVAGDDQERPDIVGRTDDGNEAIIIEGKFEAGLTDNQPNQYLSRLPTNSNGLLIFVVPQLRIDGLWREVISRANETNRTGITTNLPDGSKCVEINSRHKLLMVSWSNLLNTLFHPAQRSSDTIAGDLSQLIAFCSRKEGEAFKPFTSEELTSDHLARRHFDFCDLVDAITDRLRSDGTGTTDGMRATPQRDGYFSYVSLAHGDLTFGASIRLDYAAWREHSASPLWVGTQSQYTSELRPVFKKLVEEDGLQMVERSRTIAIPLTISPGQDFTDIVASSIERILKIMRLWSS